MKGKDLLDAWGYVDTEFVEEAKSPCKSRRGLRSRIRKPFLIAAAVTVILASVGCGVAACLSVNSIKLGNTKGEAINLEEIATGPDGSRQMLVSHGERILKDQNVLTLGGREGTASFEAAREWFRFMQEYDPDGAKLEAYRKGETDFSVPRKYRHYDPYSQEMVDKLDELSQKYDLKLLPVLEHIETTEGFGTDQLEVITKKLGMDSMFSPDSELVCTEVGRVQHNGDGRMDIFSYVACPQEKWNHIMYNHLCYVSNEYLCTDQINVFPGEEWEYTTSSGAEVIILQGKYEEFSYIICNREDANVILRVKSGYEVYSEYGDGDVYTKGDYMSREQLEYIADGYNFLFTIDPETGSDA